MSGTCSSTSRNSKKELDDDDESLCGYEAGCLGFSLYHRLKKQGIECVILAPSTMMASKGKRIKMDARDAKRIAQCLAYGTYRNVHIPSSDDDAVKEYIRMRDDHKIALKKLMPRIDTLCLRNGRQYTAGREDGVPATRPPRLPPPAGVRR